jgi:hypothetical protein
MTTRTTLTSCVIQNIAHLQTLTHDPDTGDWVVGGNGSIYRVSEVNGAQAALSSVNYQLDSIDLEPRTGRLVCTQRYSPSILVLDRNTGTCFNSFSQSPTMCVKVDDFTGHYYAVRYGTVTEFSPTGTPLNTWNQAQSFWTSVEVYGSRQVSGSGRAQAGTRYPIDFSFRGMGQAAYIAALALSQRPGIPVGNGMINLAPDALLQASLWGALVTGFSGVLDNQGNATGFISIPPSLPRGFTFFCSAVAFTGSAFQAGNTIGITIR